MEENKREHLRMIQSVISRLAGNLFHLKGWTITLIVGLFALMAKDGNREFIYVVFFPVLIFWMLDGYFLAQERCFRSLYDDVRKLKEEQIDFSMGIRKYKDIAYNTWFSATFSQTLLIFYGLQMGALFIAMCLLNNWFLPLICSL